MSAFSHLAQYFYSSMMLAVSTVLLNSIPLTRYITICLSTYQLVDIVGVSIWLL